MLKLKSFFIIALALTTACREKSKHKDGAQQAVENAENENRRVDTETTTPEIVRPQFRLFDPTYDFTPSDRFTAGQLLERFPIVSANDAEVAILPDGESFFSWRLKLIDQATKSIRLQSMIFYGDESGYQIAEKLVAAVKRGVKVSVIVDPINNLKFRDQRLFYYMRRSGIKIEGYEFAYLNLVSGFASRDLIGAKITELNQRYHEKYLVIDAEIPEKAVAIIGGTNISNEYFRVEKERPLFVWQDRDVIVRGKITADISRHFEINAAELRARRNSLGLQATQFIWTFLDNYFKDPEVNEDKLRPEINLRLQEIAKNPPDLVWHKSTMRVITSHPRAQEDLIMPAYLDSIQSSKDTVDIVNAFFIPDEDLASALKAAAKRGVKIRILTNAAEAMDFVVGGRVMTDVARSTYQDLLLVNEDDATKGSIEIYEWAADPTLKNGEGLMHAKYAVFDQKMYIVGSFNLDPRARLLNTEGILAGEDVVTSELLRDEVTKFVGPKFAKSVSLDEAKRYESPLSKSSRERLKILKLFSFYL
jgi:putative cardiolipin synthase